MNKRNKKNNSHSEMSIGKEEIITGTQGLLKLEKALLNCHHIE